MVAFVREQSGVSAITRIGVTWNCSRRLSRDHPVIVDTATRREGECGTAITRRSWATDDTRMCLPYDSYWAKV